MKRFKEFSESHNQKGLKSAITRHEAELDDSEPDLKATLNIPGSKSQHREKQHERAIKIAKKLLSGPKVG